MKKPSVASGDTPFETRELRLGLKTFFQLKHTDPKTGKANVIGS
jgi:hypothetical protein